MFIYRTYLSIKTAFWINDLLHTFPEGRAGTDIFCSRHNIKYSGDFSDKGLCCVVRG